MTASRGRRFGAITAAAGVGIAATLALGFWQLGRGQQKLALQAEIERRGAEAPITARDLLDANRPEDVLHRTVLLRGQWVPAQTVYLDNRQMRGLPGFYVVTPLRIEGSQRAVAVQRGWVQRDFTERTRLPRIETPAGTVELRGIVSPPPARLYEFRGADDGAIRQNLDLGAWRTRTGLDLLPVSVMQLGPASEGLLRDWPAPATGVERHWGYMVQWWALSALIAFLYAWFQFIVPRRKVPHAR